MSVIPPTYRGAGLPVTFALGEQLLVSLNEDGVPQAQPRLVVSGDVKGGRYVSGVDNLVVGGGLFGGHDHHRHGHRRGH
jgi:hypothetical protein